MKILHLARNGDPGRRFEEHVLGEKAVREAEKPHGFIKAPSFESSLHTALEPRVQERLGWPSPVNPPTAVCAALLLEIGDELKRYGLSPEGLGLFVSAGLELDFGHHTDLFVKWGEAVVGIDLTVSREPRDENQQHVVLRPSNLEDWSAIQCSGVRIARLLAEQFSGR